MFHDAIESEPRSGGELYGVRDVASKTAYNAARLTELLQWFEDPQDTIMSTWHCWGLRHEPGRSDTREKRNR